MTDNLDRAHVRALGEQASARRSRPFDVLDAGVEHHETISMSDLQVVRLKGWCDRFRATAREITRSHQIDGPFGLSALLLAATEGLPVGEEFHA